MEQKEKSKKKGSITVFLTILFLLFFALLGVAFEHARIMSAKGHMRVLSNAALMTLYGGYNRELFEEYGLFAYGGFDGKSEENMMEVYQTILEDNLQTRPDSVDTNYVDLYRIKNPSASMTEAVMLTENKIFIQQVEQYLKSTVVKDVTQEVVDRITQDQKDDEMQAKLAMTKDYEDGKYDPEDYEEGKKKKTEDSSKTELELSEEEALGKDEAGGNPLDRFKDAARDGVLSLVCDENKLSKGCIEPCQLDEESIPAKSDVFKQKSQNTDALDASDYLSDFVENGNQNDIEMIERGKEKAELICYANKQFASYTRQMDRTTKYGMEYLIGGNVEEKDNFAAIVNRILAIRMILNFAYVAVDAALQEKSMATATVLAGFTGLPPVISAVQYTILLILAFQEACIDVTAILEGRQVPTVKSSKNFKMRYEEICLGSRTLFAKKAKQYSLEDKNAMSISYEQYLWLFLLMNGQDTIEKRSFDLIQYDLRERYNQTFCLSGCICKGRYQMSYEVAFLFEKLPFISKGKNSIQKQSVEVRYGYKSE